MSLTCDPSLTKPPPDEMHLWDLGQSYRTGDYGGVIIKRLPPSYYVMPDSGFGFCHATWEHKVTCTQDWTEYVEELVYRQDEEGVVEYGWDCIRRVVSKTCGRANAVLETTSCPRTGP